MYKPIAFSGFIGLFFCSNAYANICDTVLLQRAFDTTSSTINSDVAVQKKNEICSETHSSVGSARQKASSSGFSLGYKLLEIGANDARQKSDQSWDISDTDFCKSSANDLKSSYSQSFNNVVAKVAVDAVGNQINNKT